jgi:hypothetical protein
MLPTSRRRLNGLEDGVDPSKGYLGCDWEGVKIKRVEKTASPPEKKLCVGTKTMMSSENRLDRVREKHRLPRPSSVRTEPEESV